MGKRNHTSADTPATARSGGISTVPVSVAIYCKQVAEITALHLEIAGQWATMLDKAIEAGALLTTVKEELPHGQWLPWIAANLPFSDRTARNYINCYANRDRLKLETVSDLTTAYKLLAPPRSNPPKPATERAILEEEIDRPEPAPVEVVTVDPVEPAKPVMFCCESCGHEVEEDEVEEQPLYECNDCGMFTRDNSADGGSHRCSGCNKWGHKISDYGCPECGEGELTKQDLAPAPSKSSGHTVTVGGWVLYKGYAAVIHKQIKNLSNITVEPERNNDRAQTIRLLVEELEALR